MLALTYPDGARVQRCDYLPEKSPISLRFDSNSSVYDYQRISASGVADRHSERPRRRSRRRTENPADINSPTGFTSPDNYGDSPSFPNFLPIYGFSERCREDDHARTESSQSTTINDDKFDRLYPSIVNDEEVRRGGDDKGEIRRRELPGRESWPGGRHPKDRCFLHIFIILVLIVLGSNRHCGRFGHGVNPTALQVFAFGTVVGTVGSAPVDIDTGVRSERSANLSHITGASRKIQMYVKNRHLQILPDGTVNGSTDDTSDFTVLQRTSVSRGQLKIQGVATCLYLCMDSCGLLYGSLEYTEDCVFNETLESHNYNTYSSAHWSTPRKTLYLGLSGQGQPRRVQARGHNLGRLSAYARVLTQVVAQDRVDALHRRMLGARHNVRHHHGSQQIVCPALAPQEKDGRDKFRCRKRKKRKKRRRKCKGGEVPGPQCDARETGGEAQSKRSCEGAALDEACRKEALDTPAKKRKSRIDDDDDFGDDVSVEKKSRRSNAQEKEKEKDRGVKKKGKKSTAASAPPTLSPAKKSGPKKKKNGANKTSKKKGRVVRTTRTLAMTSPLAWYPTQSTPLENPAADHPSASSIVVDRPKSLSSSSSSVSAVSFAATSLASTLTLTVAGGDVFAERISSPDNPTTVINDIDELVRARQDEAKDFEEEDEEQEHEDDDEELEELRLAIS